MVVYSPKKMKDHDSPCSLKPMDELQTSNDVNDDSVKIC